MLASAVFMIAQSYVTQHYEAVKFDRALRSPSNFQSDSVLVGLPIGRLRIPSVGISAIVLEGDNAGTLRVAPGHIPGTALPDQNGNVAIAGHRDTFFRGLEAVRAGDNVTLTTFHGIYEYRVDAMEVVDPARTDVLEPSGHPILTLVTCYPFHIIGPAPKRFIVRGHLIHSQAFRAQRQEVRHVQRKSQPYRFSPSRLRLFLVSAGERFNQILIRAKFTD